MLNTEVPQGVVACVYTGFISRIKYVLCMQ